MYTPPENGKPTDQPNPHPMVLHRIRRMIQKGKYGPINRWLKGLFVPPIDRQWMKHAAKSLNETP